MRLIIIVAAAISGFVLITLVFFQATRKTYPGFGRWTSGVGFLTVGYLALALRGFIPDCVSIFIGNVAFPLGMVLLLDGLRRFLGLAHMSRLWYALPAMDLLAIAVLYYLHDAPFWRTVVTAIAISAPHWPMAALIFRHPLKHESIFYPVIGTLLGLGGLVVLARPIAAFFLPQWHLFMDSPFQLGSFVMLIVLQLGESLSLMMLNSERVESELVEAEAELRLTVNRLQQSLADQKLAEESLRDSEERYRVFFETSRDGVFMTTLDGRFIEFNDVALEMLGYAPIEKQELLRRKVASFYANPEEREAHAAMVAEVGFSKDYSVDFRKKDGTIIHALVTTVARKDPQGNTIGFQGTVRDLSERDQAEEALRESNQRLSLALAGANFGIWEWDLTTGKAVWDDQSLSVLGYESDEFEPNLQNWKKLVHPEDWPRVSENLNLHLEGKLPTFEVEYRIMNKSGDWQWALARGNMIAVDEDGKPTRMAGVFADITERKKTEEALRNSEAKYRFLTEQGSDLIWTLDLNLRTTFVTPSVEKVLGFTPEERMLQEVEDQLTPESLQFARQRLFEELSMEREQGIQEGKSVLVELDYYHKNGSIVCLQTAVTFIRDEKGTPIGIHGISRDVTELKRTQEALRESAELLAEAQRVARIGNWSHDLRKNKVTWSDELYRIFGIENSDFDGRYESFLTRVHPEDQQLVLQTNARARNEGTPFDFEYRIIHPGGQVRAIREVGHANKDDAGNTIRLFGTAQDITDRKEAEQERERLRNELFQAQKMEAIGTLTGGIAHDFNNLLTIINGYTELVLSEKTSDDPGYSDLQKVLETGRKGAELVQRLLALSRKGESNPQPLDINPTVKNSVALLKRTLPKMIEIETVLGKDLSMVSADAAQVDQVLMNLCINAKEAMPEGGKLRIETKNVIVDASDCRLQVAAKPGSYVLIEVADTGTGMDAETLDRLFDPFFTTKGWDFKKGTGLSLPVAKGIVEQHGGWITCESEPGKGTTFTVYFPAIEEPPVVRKSESLTELVPGWEKILLVDDEEYVRALGKRILERAGYTVITAANGKEALEIYSREQSNIALVVLDLVMPQMEGKQCLEELLKIHPKVKVIVSTGHSLDARERMHLGTAARGFVNKPYKVGQLVQTVKEVMDAGGAAG